MTDIDLHMSDGERKHDTHVRALSTQHFLRALFFGHTMSALLSSFICGFAEVFLVTRAVSSCMHDVPQSLLHFP